MQGDPSFFGDYGAPLLALAGTAAQIKANNDENAKKRAILNAQLQRNNETTDRALTTIQGEGQNFSPQARMEAMVAAEARNMGQTQADLGGANLGETAVGYGATSPDFVQAKAQKAVDEGNRLTAIARETARARAPGAVGLDDRLRIAGMQGDLNSMYGSNRNMANAAGLDAEAVGPGALANFGKVASALGQGMAMGQRPRAGVNFGGQHGGH